MGTYVVTGSASGMGAAVAARLAAAGNSVVGVDLRDATVIADLSSPDGRASAASAVAALAPSLDGAVLAAGIGPLPGLTAAILEVNYFGVVSLLEAWRPLLVPGSKVVVVASNSATVVPLVPRGAINALLAGSSPRALASVRRFGRLAPTMAYAASKNALSRWVRRTAVLPSWAGAGIRLNAIAPGAVRTPLLESQLADPAQARQVRSFPIPVGGFGEPDQIASWVLHMLSDAADFLCGSVVFVDGGSDALLRADDWPRTVPVRRLRSYFRLLRGRARS